MVAALLGTSARRWALVLAAAVVAADQLSKWWIVTGVMSPPRVIEITGFFDIVMVWNSGVTFGLFSAGGMRWVLVGVSLAIVVLLVGWLARTDAPAPALAIGAVIGGAIGNVVDRLNYGKVADFLDFHAFGWHWPAFNLADTAIVCGVAVILFDAFTERSE
jgi:signal peptidase II